jgi:hypothetical protein
MKSLIAAACSLVLASCVLDLSDDDNGNPGSGAQCGGFAGGTCDSDEFCDWPNEECGIADGAGVCHGRPLACTDIYMPVQGSDGVIYGNACEAHMAGADDCGPAPQR